MRGRNSIGLVGMLAACGGGPEPPARTPAETDEPSALRIPAVSRPTSEAAGAEVPEEPKPQPPGTTKALSTFEVTRSFDVELHPGHAVIKLRLDAVAGAGAPPIWSASLGGDGLLPSGVVATGLRVLARTPDGNGWRDAALVAPAAARAGFTRQPGAAGAAPSGLLEWVGPGMWGLHVGPCTAASPCTAEVQFVTPTYFDEGNHRLTFGAIPEGQAPVQVRVRPGNTRDGLLLDGKPIARDAPLVVADKELTLALARSERRALEGELVSHRLGPKRFLTRWRYETPTRLSEVPAGLHSVVVIDGSRSLAASDFDNQIVAAAAYLDQLAQVPGARAAVVRFDRKPTAISSGFVTPNQASSDVKSMSRELANGSHVDRALAEAARLLSKVPRAAARRVVMFTDTLTRKSLDARRLAPSLAKARALVHVISLGGARDPAVTSRADEHSWARSVRRTGGLVWSANVSTVERTRAAAERWLRPTQIEGVAVTGLPPDWGEAETMMVEGESRSSFSVTEVPVPRLAVRGELWSRAVTLNLRSSPRRVPLWAALALGDNGVNVEDSEVKTLAKVGHAVSNHTSLLVALPGERKLPELEGYASSSSCCAPHGMPGRGIWGVGRAKHRHFDALGHLSRALAAARVSCKVPKQLATVTVETSYSEVIDVKVRLQKPNPTQADCLTEAAWSLTLPVGFRQRVEASYPVRL